MKEISYQVFLDEAENEKLRIKIKPEKGKVTDMVIQYETYFNNKWIAIIRYDCAHGFFHRDVMHQMTKKQNKL